MSEVIKKCNHRELAHLVKANDKFYYIDSTHTFDNGYETMVFGVETDNIDNFDTDSDVDWSGVFSQTYQNEAIMEMKHLYMIKNLEEFLGKVE